MPSRAAAVLVLVALLTPLSAGDEEQPSKPKSNADVAEAAIHAFEQGDAEAFARLAALDNPDPWISVESLLWDERVDVATRFASAAVRKGTERLPAYVEAHGASPVIARDGDVMSRVLLLIKAKEWAAAVERAASIETDPDTVSGIYATFLRAHALQKLGRDGEAEAVFARTAEAAGAVGWTRRAATCHQGVAVLKGYRRDWQAAIAATLHQLEGVRTLGDLAWEGGALSNLGVYYRESGDTAKALASFERAVELGYSTNDRVRTSSVLLNLSQLLIELGRYEDALKRLDAAGRLKRELGDASGLADVELSRAVSMGGLGDYDQAITVLEQVLAERKRHSDPHREATALVQIGRFYRRKGDLMRALAFLRRGGAVWEKLGDERGRANLYQHLGDTHSALGERAKAIAYRERGLRVYRELGDPLGIAQALGNLGVSYAEGGDHRKALACYEESLARMEAVGSVEGVAGILLNMGNVHQRQGHGDRALALWERARGIYERLGRRDKVATIVGNIGGHHLAGDEFEKALPCFEFALEEATRRGDRQSIVLRLSSIGSALGGLRRFEEAERTLKRANREARRLRATPLLASGHGSLAAVYLDRDEPDRALVEAHRALDAVESMLSGLGDLEGGTARQAHDRVFGIGTLAAARLGDAMELTTFLESGRAGALLESLAGGRAIRFADLPEALLAEEAGAKAQERRARRSYEQALAAGDRRAIRVAARGLDDAVERVRASVVRIQREATRIAGLFYPKAATLEEIQGWLEDGEALVLYGLSLGIATALIVTPDSETIVELGAVAAIQAACDAAKPVWAAQASRGPLAEDADAPPPATFGPAVADLRALLVNPLELPDDVKTVLVSPEGPLCYVPFGALFESRNVVLTPSGTTHVLLMEEERDPGEGVLALGDPAYGTKVDAGAAQVYRGGAKLTALPATRDEALAIGDVTLLGDDATEVKLREAIAKQDRWRAVHLACHGLVDPDRPTLSSLALTETDDEDGFLTALEVLRMEIPADLAVLSACETAKGKVVKGEGIVGLTRAFMYAGSPRVLCSLWKVDDDATRALMEKFYELWNPKEGEGLPAAEALRKAQAHVRGHEKWARPYYWAAWVLWGLP